MTMHLTTFWDYFAGFILTVIIISMAYLAYSGAHGISDEKDKQQLNVIIQISFIIWLCVWAFRQLFF